MAGAPTASVGNEISYYGPDASFSYGPLTFTGQYLIRTDSNPNGLAVEPVVEIETTGIVAELVYLPGGDNGRYSFLVLYNDIGSDLAGENYRSASFGAGYLLARNLRAHAEYTRDLHNDLNRVVMGFVSGF